MTARTLKKGDIVYTTRHWTEGAPTFSAPLTVERIRKASSREVYNKSDHVWVVGDRNATRAARLTHADDLTPEQAQAVKDQSAERARLKAESDDSAARLNARNKATLDANRDKLDAAPVYGPVVMADGGYRRVSEDTKPIGSTFTYWATVRDQYGALSVAQRTDWCGVRVQRKSEGRAYSWGISLGGTTYTQAEGRVIADSIALALAIIPTLGDPRPSYDRD